MKGLTNSQSGSASIGYTVTFKVSGNDYYVSSCLVGDSVLAPEKPTISGYVFGGWLDNGTAVTFPYTPTADVTLNANMLSAIIVGFTGMTNSDSTLTWTDDIAHLQGSPAYTLETSGSYVTVKSVLEEIWPFSYITEMTDAQGNVFVKFPKMWQKWSFDASGNLDGVKFSNVQADSEYFINDAFLKSDDLNAYNDYFALGKYEGSGSSSQMYSKTGLACLVNVTRAQCRTAARANGATYQQLDLAQYVLYNMLTMLKYRTSNIQNVYAGRTSASEATTTGDCDAISGLDGWNTATGAVKMNGVENPYGNINKWVDGVWFSDTQVYVHRLPTQFTDGTTNAVLTTITRPSSNGYTEYLKPSGRITQQSYVYCTDANGSASTYYGDGCYYYSPTGTVLYVGGYWSSAAYAGLWYLYGSLGESRTYSYIGARLSYRPS